MHKFICYVIHRPLFGFRYAGGTYWECKGCFRRYRVPWVNEKERADTLVEEA